MYSIPPRQSIPATMAPSPTFTHCINPVTRVLPPDKVTHQSNPIQPPKTPPSFTPESTSPLSSIVAVTQLIDYSSNNQRTQRFKYTLNTTPVHRLDTYRFPAASMATPVGLSNAFDRRYFSPVCLITYTELPI